MADGLKLEFNSISAENQTEFMSYRHGYHVFMVSPEKSKILHMIDEINAITASLSEDERAELA